MRPIPGLLVAAAAYLTAPPGSAQAAPTAKPPRVDGPYLGTTALGSLGFARVNDLDTGAFGGFGGAARVGDAVLPWMTIGLQIFGNLAYGEGDGGAQQRLGQGGLAGELGFLPARRYPFSFRVGFGVGGGGVREQGRRGRKGFGGAMFTGALRYEFFPGVDRRRPTRGGGFGLGPEIGWIGATPPAKGRPMSNTVYVALALTYYFGS